MDYDDARAFLSSLANYERGMPRRYDTTAFDLAAFAGLLGRLGNPQNAYPILHVAGTKGKGSAAAMAAAAFRAAGRRVGVFSSPHLQTVRERMTIDGEMITPAPFGRYVGAAREAMASSLG